MQLDNADGTFLGHGGGYTKSGRPASHRQPPRARVSRSQLHCGPPAGRTVTTATLMGSRVPACMVASNDCGHRGLTSATAFKRPFGSLQSLRMYDACWCCLPWTVTSPHTPRAQEVDTGNHSWANYFLAAYKVRQFCATHGRSGHTARLTGPRLSHLSHSSHAQRMLVIMCGGGNAGRL